MTVNPRRHSDDPDQDVLVLAGDAVGPELAARLSGSVVAVSTEPGYEKRFEDAQRTVLADEPATLPAESLDVSAAILAHPKESLNLLYATRLVGQGTENVVVRVDDPSRESAFEDLPVRTVSPTPDVVERLHRRYVAERPIRE